MNREKEKDNIQFQLGKFSQFKEDICKQIGTLEKTNGEKFEKISEKMGQMDGKLDDLNIWRVKVVSYTAGVTSIAYFILSRIF